MQNTKIPVLNSMRPFLLLVDCGLIELPYTYSLVVTLGLYLHAILKCWSVNNNFQI